GRGGAYVLFHHDIRRPADQDEVLHIVPPHKHQPPLIIDRGRIHHGEPRRPVAATCYEGARGQIPHHAYDDEHAEEKDERGGDPERRRGQAALTKIPQPFAHLPLSDTSVWLKRLD